MRLIITAFAALLLVSLANASREITVQIEQNFCKEDNTGTASFTLLDKPLTGVTKGMNSSIAFAKDKGGRLVAIKYVKLILDPKDARKKTREEVYLRNEFKALQTLVEKLLQQGQELVGIPEMYCLGMANVIANSTEKYLVIVMEYFPQTLSRFRNLNMSVHMHIPMTDEDIVKYTIQILKILKLYQLGDMVHRDLKPENIMVDRNGNLYIIDPGYAHYNGNYIPQEKNGFPPRLGSLLYQHVNDMVVVYKVPDTKSDLYAVVVMMAEFVMGVNALEADVRLKGKTAEPGDQAKYSGRVAENWWLPHSRSRLNETLESAYSNRPKELQDIVKSMFKDVMSTETVDYDTYLKPLSLLVEKLHKNSLEKLQQAKLTGQGSCKKTPRCSGRPLKREPHFYLVPDLGEGQKSLADTFLL